MNGSVSALIVEDDAEIGELMARFLCDHQVASMVVVDGAAADAAMAERAFDIVILDLNLPGESGLSICRRLREARGVPIIIVTAQGDEVDRIVGLEAGADDYMAKPFNPRELLARIRSVLRRAAPRSREGAVGSVFTFGEWRVDVPARELRGAQDARIALTGAEFDLLHVLCEYPNRVLTRDQLLGMTHGPVEGPNERSIDVLVSRLRQKLEADPRNPQLILTVRAEGYLFDAQVRWR